MTTQMTTPDLEDTKNEPVAPKRVHARTLDGQPVPHPNGTVARQATFLTIPDAPPGSKQEQALSWQTVHARRQPVKLTPEEAAKRNAAMATTTPEVNHAALPVVYFPTVPMIDSDLTGDVGGITFYRGVARTLHSFRRLAGLSAAGFKLKDIATGTEISAMSVNTTWMAENQFWNEGQTVPQRSLDLLAQVEGLVKATAVTATLTSVAKPAETKPTPNASTAGVVAPPAAEGDVNKEKIDILAGLINRLRPGHKEDWTSAGVPDCNRLAVLLERKIGTRPDMNARVSKAERDAAWREYGLNRTQEDLTVPGGVENAFKVVTDVKVPQILEHIGKQKGKAFLRQFAESRGVKDPAKEIDTLIGQILATNPTHDEVKQLA